MALSQLCVWGMGDAASWEEGEVKFVAVWTRDCGRQTLKCTTVNKKEAISVHRLSKLVRFFRHSKLGPMRLSFSHVSMSQRCSSFSVGHLTSLCGGTYVHS